VSKPATEILSFLQVLIHEASGFVNNAGQRSHPSEILFLGFPSALELGNMRRVAAIERSLIRFAHGKIVTVRKFDRICRTFSLLNVAT
jgi:hypothetical protein